MEPRALSPFIIFIILLSIHLSIQPNQQVVQTVLDGATINQFVTQLPTFYGNRADGTKKLKVTVEEIQQRILPDSFYDALPSKAQYKSAQNGKTVAVINPRKGTYIWGYKICDGKKTLGPSFPAATIESQREIKTKIDYHNNLLPFEDNKGHTLPGPLLQKFLTVDLSLAWANSLCYPQYLQCTDTSVLPCPPVPPATENQFPTFLPYGNPGFYEGPQPLVTHLHGGETPSAFDGGPDSWFTPHQKITGPTFVTNKYMYLNTQPATTLWYHDHVLGETRLNVFAGLAGFYFLRGEPESSVNPPLPSGPYEIEMAISDRQFDTNGQLFFPDGNPCKAGLNGDPSNPILHPYFIPEFFGDVICVNGKSWPYLEVEPRRYRIRMLNGSNARMYGLYLSDSNGDTNNVPTIWQIGSDGGLFDSPVQLNFIPFSYDPTIPGPVTIDNFPNSRLFLAPGERADLIIDFSTVPFNSTFILNNGSPAPFPSNGTSYDPNVEGHVMQFSVTKKLSRKDKSYNPLSSGPLRTGAHKIVQFTDGNGNLLPDVKPNLTRSLVLIEQEDPVTGAPVTILLNNTHYNGINPFTNKPVPDSVCYNKGTIYVTEIPQVGSTEIWELINLTPDTHPIHLHLVQFQLLNRQVFNVGNVVPPFGPPFGPKLPDNYRYDQYETAWFGQENPPYPSGSMAGTVYGAGSPNPYLSTNPLGGNPHVTPYLQKGIIAPDPNEASCWKDTIKAFPGTVTRLVVRFAPQTIPVDQVQAGENKYPFDPTAKLGKKDCFGYPGGGGYVWHCHIIDHEDNDMMRPLQISNSSQQ